MIKKEVANGDLIFLYDSILKVLLEKETFKVLKGSFTFTIVILS